jgi:hypothetical protein
MADTTAQAEVRCERTDLLVSSCAHCHPNPEGEKLAAALGAFGRQETIVASEPEPAPDSPGFRAHWPGWCPRCRTGFAAGEWIRADGHSAYTHVDCP